VFEQAITALQEQLERERSRVDRAESHLEEARGRLDQLQAALGDAIAAERIAAGEASALRAELDHHRKRAARPWWRRR
jgi:predicted  nucleic acid-binding Zn-ribbon protein